MSLTPPARVAALCLVLGVSLLLRCESPQTFVVIDNGFPPSAMRPLVILTAFWQAVRFETPIVPGTSSAPQATIPATDNIAYVLLAPGWDPTSSTPPASFIVLQSRTGFTTHLGDTLHIPVDDTTFMGNCAAGSFLTQDQADFITRRVFSSEFAGLHYDAATCTTTPAGDGGGP